VELLTVGAEQMVPLTLTMEEADLKLKPVSVNWTGGTQPLVAAPNCSAQPEMDRIEGTASEVCAKATCKLLPATHCERSSRIATLSTREGKGARLGQEYGTRGQLYPTEERVAMTTTIESDLRSNVYVRMKHSQEDDGIRVQIGGPGGEGGRIRQCCPPLLSRLW
jgi:hypothetical protein